jgi:hypothetical protein
MMEKVREKVRLTERSEIKRLYLVVVVRCVCDMVGFLAHTPCRKDERARDDEVGDRVPPPPPIDEGTQVSRYEHADWNYDEECDGREQGMGPDPLFIF